MKKLLLITGDLAAGKSTFARLLSERYGIPAIHKDSFKEVIADSLGFADREQNLKLSRTAVALMVSVFSSVAPSGHDVVLEANFHTPEHEALLRLGAACGYSVLTVVVRGDTDILYPRYLHRIEHENRHPAHLSAPLHIREEFEEYIRQARAETYGGRLLQVNANDFSYQTDPAVLHSIDVFMAEF